MKNAELKPCQKYKIPHNIDMNSVEHLIANEEAWALGYRFRATCTICGQSIVAKTLKEYKESL